jgi:pantoate--beta-alanine ligase
MRMVITVAAMQQQALRWRRLGIRVGLVPTMGYLHAGHISLVRQARKQVGPRGMVTVSIFVNPTQFAPNEDFSQYPRDLSGDARLCQEAGVDVVFAPRDTEMYPSAEEGKFSTYVVEEQLSPGLEGQSRPTHFRGVTTVVAKLFNIVQPTVAVFGAKDFQQAAVIKRMVRDLNFPVKLEVAPIWREPDGLAMSSRNKYLQGTLRTQAVVLSRAIQKAKDAVREDAGPISAARLKAQLKAFIEKEPEARVDYVEFFDPRTLAPVRKVARDTHLGLAVFIGKTRLIDNASLA